MFVVLCDEMKICHKMTNTNFRQPRAIESLLLTNIAAKFDLASCSFMLNCPQYVVNKNLECWYQ